MTADTRVDTPVTRERKLLLSISGVVIIAALAAVGYLAVMGMLVKIDGIALALISLLIAAVFAGASLPEIFSMYPLPPAVDEVASHEEGADEAHGASVQWYMVVWGMLLAFTLVEIGLAYLKMTVTPMLIILMALSIIKATLIIAYFMHLRFERMSLVLTLMPALVLCISLLSFFFPDSFRMRDLGRDHEMLKVQPMVSEEGGTPSTQP